MKMKRAVPAISLMLSAMAIAPAFGQAPPPPLPPPQLDPLVARIALYPDPLIAQILAAATFPDQIAPAASYADQHHYLTGQALAAAIQADQVPWDPSVQALIPFPSVLDMMNSDMNWTSQLGNAFLVQQPDVMDAIQRERAKAQSFGYLRSNAQIVVGGAGPYITIVPANPAFICVPYYDPAIVFVGPRPGYAISFGFGITIGAFFRPWGWGVGLGVFDWGAHAMIINGHPWGRNWGNRATYVHPYEGVRRVGPGGARPAEAHKLEGRSPEERKAAQTGKRMPAERHGKR
jgi:hypothetical protein